jgi:inhibitor of KinA sporulation pathway (predicted exonuclease)
MDNNPFEDNNFFVYQTTVELEDNVILVVITDGPVDSEDIIQDYVYQRHYDAQPDKSKYRTVNLSKDFERVYELANPVHMKLTMKAIDYTACYS